ncbi:MAG TPA: alpha/beta fold hydrolase [Steroidobacteraceae bacterium]|jgi:pimeloyl-ACP methyl ester carboxylesterase/DNA-binding CsgD family transcriptional regulator
MAQSIRYLKTRDGVRLAWATLGQGPALVKAANWLSHLTYDLESPIWRHWIEFLSQHHRLIRYDERGSGMSDWEVADLSPARWGEDLEAIVEASDPGEQFVLLGMSQGAAAAITYAVCHPKRISRLILYGGYSKGWAQHPESEGYRRYRAIVDLVQLGWGKDNPAFRQLFTAQFVPGASPEQFTWFNELCRRTTTPEIATRLLAARGELNVRDQLARVRVPTLVLHARHDEIVPFDAGKQLAAEIPDAQFVPLDSRNHILLADEPAWTHFKDAVLEFTGRPRAVGAEDPLLATLSVRERQILAAVMSGQSNAAIGAALFVSDKTVRNSLTRIFEKLGVRTRTQAALMARDRGFSGP